MRGMEPNSVDAIVTDPPYGLEFMGKEWDKLELRDLHGNPLRSSEDAFASSLGKQRKGGDPFIGKGIRFVAGRSMQNWHYAWAIEALRVAKPGCHLLAFGGTRTFHRLACAIEDAGWEIRDTLMWVYGSGFPKSHDVSKAIDKAAGAKREVVGTYRISGLTPDRKNFGANDRSGGQGMGFRPGDIPIAAPATDAARQWEGWGTALKPAWEPIIMARKPLEGTVAANVQKWGTGAINVDGCRVGAESHIVHGKEAGKFQPTGGTTIKDYHSVSGRWPANLIHDGSEEVLELFPETISGGNIRRKPSPSSHFGSGSNENVIGTIENHGDSGSAARFFYCAKASRAEREAGCEGMALRDGPSDNYGTKAVNLTRNDLGPNEVKRAANVHPCVKPLALMRYLVRLVTPPNGTILDPFMGSGTTGMAAKIEGFRFIGIEKEQEYIEIAERRIEATEWRAR